MNIVNKLTWRHMRKNKRQTLVTIIGVIISVAMVTGVATLAFSFMDLMQKQTIAQEGEWHVQYHDVSDEQLVSIEADKQTKDVFLQRPVGYATLEDGQNDHKPYVHLVEFNDQAFEQYPIHLTEGRLPENEHEVLLSEHIETNGQVEYEIGDEITWEIGERVTEDPDWSESHFDQSYSLIETEGEINETLEAEETRDVTVVGFIERPTWELSWAPGYTVISYLDDATVSADQPVNAFVNVNKVNRSIFKNSEHLADELNIGSYDMHDSLLRYSFVISNDGMFYALFTFVAIIMAIIMVGSISLIYNAFAISVSERSRHLGMLSSVGATKKQKRNSVFFEGAIIGLISIPIGVISGLVGMGITFYFVNSLLQDVSGISERLTVTITPLSIIVACAVSMLTLFLSTYIPAKRASKVTAIDAIRQTMDVKMTSKEVKTSKLVRRIFGIEAEFGLKNLKRNKRRYSAVVFSLVVSIVLFLTVSFFTEQMKQTSSFMQGNLNYDIELGAVSRDGADQVFDDSFINSISSIDEVTATSFMQNMSLKTILNEKQLPDGLDEFVENGEIDAYVTLYVLEEEDLEDYAKAVGINYSDLTKEDKMTGIIFNKALGSGERRGETIAVQMNIGDSLEVIYDDWEENEQTVLGDIEVVALTDKRPMGVRIEYQ